MKIKKSVYIYFFSFLLIVFSVIALMPNRAEASMSESSFASKIAELQQIYKDGEYWNGYNGYDCTGHQKCSCSPACSGSCSCSCGKFYLNGQYYGGQCYGFANKMGYLCFGSVPTASWSKESSVSEYYAGDYVRVRNDRHSIFITKVEGNTVTYVDCNNAGPCMVKWNRTISVSSLNSVLSYVYHMPGNTLKGTNAPPPTPTPSIDWTIDGRFNTPIVAVPAATSGKITVYDENLNAYSTNNAYIDYMDECTIYEIYTNGFCLVEYPTSNGSILRYTKTSEFFTCSITPYTYIADTGLTSYQLSTMKTVFGSVSAGDHCTVVEKDGSKLHVIYPISGKFKLGWIQPSQPIPIGKDFQPMIPITAYNYSADTRTTVYESRNSMGVYWGQIFPDDRCTINAVNISENWVNVSYPVTGGTKTGYVYFDQFFPSYSSVGNVHTTTVSTTTTTYRKADMAVEFGWINPGDEITVVGKQGNLVQVLYPIDEQYAENYKLAWIYDSNMVKQIHTITVESRPSKTNYLEGESFSSSGLKLRVYYTDGSSSVVSSGFTCSNYNAKMIGNQNVIITYQGQTTAVDVNVVSKSPTTLTILNKPTKTVYQVGDLLDMTGFKLKVSYDNGTSENITEYYVEEEYLESVGTQTIHVHYVYNEKDVSTSFNVQVSASELKSGNLSIKSSQLNLKQGDSFTVNLGVTNNPGFCVLKGQVTYDSSKLELTNVQNSGILSSLTKAEENGQVSLLWDNGFDVSSNQTLATLTFKVKSDAATGNTNLQFKFLGDSSNWNEQKVNWNDSSVYSLSISEKDVISISPEDFAVICDQSRATKGSNVSLGLNIQNNPGISYLRLTVKTTEGITLNSVDNGNVIKDLDQGTNLLWSALANSTTNGKLATLHFEVGEDVAEGEYPIQIIVRECYNESSQTLDIKSFNGLITVSNSIYGDVNGDTKVNGLDVLLLRQYMANFDDDSQTSTIAVEPGSDANGDGKINGLDVLLLRQYMANFDDEIGTSTIVLGPTD